MSYPSSNYNNLMSSSQLTVDNVALHQEVIDRSNSDGTGSLAMAESLKVLYNPDTTTGALVDLYLELGDLYLVGLDGIDGDSSHTGENPSISNATVDVFTNSDHLRLKRDQSKMRQFGFEAQRLLDEITLVSSLPKVSFEQDVIYPSSLPSPDRKNGF